MTADVRGGADRAATTTSWLNSQHSFSFGDHYDPANTHHGLLMVNNEDTLAPGAGFDTHPHRDMEIVTWVLDGELTHRDSLGNAGVIYPGLAQRMSAGSGIQHSERNGSGSRPVHFVQMGVLPDEAGRTPGYQQQEVDDELAAGHLVTIASGIRGRDGAITIGNRNVALHAARPAPGASVVLPQAPYLHLFVARGQLMIDDLEGGTALRAGDAVRFTADGGGLRVTAGTGAEILVWEMHADIRGPSATG